MKTKDLTAYNFRPTKIKLQVFKLESKSGTCIIHEGSETPKSPTLFAVSLTAPKENPKSDERGLTISVSFS